MLIKGTLRVVTVKYTQQNKHSNTHISLLIQLFFSHNICTRLNFKGLPWAYLFTALSHRVSRFLCVTIFSSHVCFHICVLHLCLKISSQPEEISKSHFQLFRGQCLIGVHSLLLVLSGHSWNWHILMAWISSVSSARLYHCLNKCLPVYSAFQSSQFF